MFEIEHKIHAKGPQKEALLKNIARLFHVLHVNAI